jgi:chaperonin GroES
MEVRPLHDRVFVKRLENEEDKVGSIFVPDSAKEKPQQAKVVSVGDGRILETGKRAPLTVQAGDRILFGKYSGAEVKVDGQEFLILREDEILAVLD